ncbi:MAG: 3-dehydroquinate synthase [Alistipes sp.]|nr:3-dehydroquinate synthase [Alistipes sp.]
MIKVTDHSAIYIGDAIEQLSRLIGSDKRVIAITDENVAKYHAALVEQFEHIVVPAGEAAKSLACAEQLYVELIERQADRSTLLLAIGGGVVTDLTGFVAATYMRGLHFGFVPTTLLAMVDAAIGGKNGVNLNRYKNMVGTFRQPDFVVCDVSMLQTLSDRDFRSGLAEVIKAAVIADSQLFEKLEHSTFEQLRCDAELLQSCVEAAMRVKVEVVRADEFESGLRRVLNLGHTVAHAIEQQTSDYTHGEAVAIGMAEMCRVALRHSLIMEQDALKIVALIEHLGFNTAMPVSMDDALRVMLADKKREGDTLHLILPTSISGVKDVKVACKELSEFLGIL